MLSVCSPARQHDGRAPIRQTDPQTPGTATRFPLRASDTTWAGSDRLVATLELPKTPETERRVGESITVQRAEGECIGRKNRGDRMLLG